MLNADFRRWLVCGVWLVTLTAVIMSSVAMHALLSTSLILLVLGMTPAVVTLLLAAGARQPSMVEILHTVHAKDGTRS